MRMRAATGILICCCCAGLSACTAASSKGPAAAVTTPAPGRPPAPSSVQAAMSTEAFTPYAGLGAATDDGLAPGETYQALHTACMQDAGYGQYASDVPFSVRANRGLAFAQPWGPWGYVGIASAAQSGFEAGINSPAEGGFAVPPPPSSSLPAGAQAAGGKCLNIVYGFNDAQFAGSTAGIETMNNDVGTDMVRDPAVKQATKAWLACMARNGYNSAPDPDTLALNELDSLGLRAIGPGGPPAAPTTAQQQAQIAEAVTDADCTLSTDLAGIFFADQASYEQQLVDANQQSLNAEVREYKAAYAMELRKLPALLRTASAIPNLPGPHGRHGGPKRTHSPRPGSSPTG